MSELDVSILKQVLAYDKETGVLTWRTRPATLFDDTGKVSAGGKASRWNKRFAGKPALTYKTNYGYLTGHIMRRLYMAHRAAWAIHYGEWPDGQIDHINHNRTDNRIANMRVVSHAENAKNQKLRASNTSGVCGVSYNQKTQRWRARITADGRERTLGYFASFSEAVEARKASERECGFHANHGTPTPKP